MLSVMSRYVIYNEPLCHLKLANILYFRRGTNDQQLSECNGARRSRDNPGDYGV